MEEGLGAGGHYSAWLPQRGREKACCLPEKERRPRGPGPGPSGQAVPGHPPGWSKCRGSPPNTEPQGESRARERHGKQGRQPRGSRAGGQGLSGPSPAGNAGPAHSRAALVRLLPGYLLPRRKTGWPSKAQSRAWNPESRGLRTSTGGPPALPEGGAGLPSCGMVVASLPWPLLPVVGGPEGWLHTQASVLGASVRLCG